MLNFINRNKYKIFMVVFLFVLLLTLTGCRTNSEVWYNKPYLDGWKGYGSEFSFQKFKNGQYVFDFWQALWGWPISLLSWPIAWLCSTIGKGLGDSFFFGILFTTLIVRTLAWPIYSKQNSMSLKTTLMQPEINKLQAKYANRKDPQSQQQMQMEMMKIYKKHGVSPLGCLLPMFIQFPLFISMYEVVKRLNCDQIVNINGVEIVQKGAFALSNTKVFGFFELNTSFFDASAGIWDKVFAAVLAAAYAAITLFSQHLAQKKPSYMKDYQKNRPMTQQQEQQQKQMKMMNYMMVIMFVFMALSSTSLALYWFIGGAYQIFQSFVGRKLNERKYKKTQQKGQVI